MTTGPITVFSRKQLDRSARITLHETLKERPQPKPKKKQAPGSYASPKPEGAAPPRTMQFSGTLAPIGHQYVREEGSDFLKYRSRGVSC